MFVNLLLILAIFSLTKPTIVFYCIVTIPTFIDPILDHYKNNNINIIRIKIIIENYAVFRLWTYRKSYSFI